MFTEDKSSPQSTVALGPLNPGGNWTQLEDEDPGDLGGWSCGGNRKSDSS
jgi:hypothetical protein